MIATTPKIETAMSVHDMATEQGIEMTNEKARVIANALIIISADLGLTVTDKKYRTTKDNPDYESQLLDRHSMAISDEIKLPALKKRISQSYNVKAFDRSLVYQFLQLSIILENTPETTTRTVAGFVL